MQFPLHEPFSRRTLPEPTPFNQQLSGGSGGPIRPILKHRDEHPHGILKRREKSSSPVLKRTERSSSSPVVQRRRDSSASPVRVPLIEHQSSEWMDATQIGHSYGGKDDSQFFGDDPSFTSSSYTTTWSGRTRTTLNTEITSATTDVDSVYYRRHGRGSPPSVSPRRRLSSSPLHIREISPLRSQRYYKI